MSAFTMVMDRRPISGNKGPNAHYTEALREAASVRRPLILVGPLYARILWFHKDPTGQDVDNIAKRILDALKGLVFEDDGAVSHCLAARIDATMDYELSGSPSSDGETERLLEFLSKEACRHVIYVEIGVRTSTAVNFGEVS
jgi:Endodeoxyribonuclease RusA